MAHGLTLDWILDTHPHADHLSAAGYLQAKTGAPTATGEKVVEVQRLWKDIYNMGVGFRTDGSQWDRLLADGESFRVGTLDVVTMLSPGHTLCSVSYLTSGCAFIHDTLFMPDSGTARATFPGPIHAGSGAASSKSCSFPARPGCSRGMIFVRVAGWQCGRAPLANRSGATPM